METKTKRKSSRLQEMRVLALLRERPRTSAELAPLLGLRKSMTNIYLYRLNRAVPRRVYIIDHATHTHGAGTAIWAEGDKPNIEFIPRERRVKKITQEERNQQVLKALEDGPLTAKQIGAKIYLVHGTVSSYLKRMRQGENKRVYICRYAHPREVNPDATSGGDWAPVFAIGNKPDVPKPKRETSAERYARLKKIPGYKKVRREQRKESYLREQVRNAAKKAGKQSWLSALGF